MTQWLKRLFSTYVITQLETNIPAHTLLFRWACVFGAGAHMKIVDHALYAAEVTANGVSPLEKGIFSQIVLQIGPDLLPIYRTDFDAVDR